MKRSRLLTVISVIVVFITSTSGAYASIAPGGKCTKAGQISVSKNVTYVCATVGKQKLWIAAGGSNAAVAKPMSQADKDVKKACETFPSGLNSLAHPVGSGSRIYFEHLVTPSLELIMNAASSDSKYLSLRTAAWMLYQHVVLTVWVQQPQIQTQSDLQQSLDVVNATCGSRLSLG